MYIVLYMRYYIKIDRKGYPVSGSLVYTKSKPNNGRWFEIERICPNEDGLCIQPPKPDGYFQRLKYYYVTDECCHPIAGSNIVAYCPPTGNYFEYFPTCLINPCPTNPPLSATVIVLENIICYGGEASLEVMAEGGFPPYTGTGVFKVLAGNQEFIVTDSEGNIVMVPINVTQPGLIMISASSDIITVHGGYSTIDAQASNGVEPYLFQLDGNTQQSSGLFVDVLAGHHEIKVTDANDCENTLPLDITQPDPLVSTISILQEILCYGDLAQIEVTAIGGTPPYTGTGIFNIPAQSGDYYVAVTDYYGNSAQQNPVSITQPDILVIQNISYTPIPVYGDTTDLTVTASGGTLPYTYSIDGITYVPNPITNVGAGSFTVYVKDANDCIDTTPLVITQPAQDFAVCPDCLPVLGSVTQNQLGLLSTGAMTSSTCTLGDYVIDWYLDSITSPTQPTFASANSGNTTVGIAQFHPFSIPSQGGSWIPVIRYAYFDSIKYTSTLTPGSAYASDLAACLTPIDVLNLNCIVPTIGQPGYNAPANSATQYSHRFAYVNSVSLPADASKTLGFDLNSDGSTQYLAWRFDGFTISDRITFTYISPLNSTSTVLQDYAIGTDVGAQNFVGTPKKVPNAYDKTIIDISAITYALGDYILINIAAGYTAPTNTNTNWVVYLKCLEIFDTTWTRAVLDPCSPVMTYNTGLCRYDLTYGFSTFDNNATTDIYKYLTTFYGTSNGVVFSPTISTNFSNGQQSCDPVATINYNPACTAAAGSYTFTKTGATVVYQFSSVTDYNKYESEYNATIVALTPVGPVPATSDLNYYRFIRMFLQKYNNDSCGDSASINTNFSFHYLSPVVFDPILKTMTITTTVVDGTPYFSTVGACAGTCSSLVYLTAANGYVSAANTTYTAATTQVKTSNGIYYEHSAPVTTTSTRIGSATYNTPYYPTVPVTLADGWYSRTSGANRYAQYYFNYEIITITDSLDGVNNFKIQTPLNTSGVYVGTLTTIYEISGGVVITPSAGCP